MILHALGYTGGSVKVLKAYREVVRKEGLTAEGILNEYL